jgi:hypothetical protein
MKTQGRCIYCDKMFAGGGISRHLATHLDKMPPDGKSRSFHLRVKAGPWFLNILMDGDTQLDELDDFLRAIWLECCGHLSKFCYRSWDDEIPMSTSARRVFDKDVKLWYAYDFGSTTELEIRCLGSYPVSSKKEGGIKLLSRNERLDTPCDSCGKAQAAWICTAHYYEGEDMFFCDKCVKKHEKTCEDAEYALMPVVNSPRMGECAYEGGTIDLERG